MQIKFALNDYGLLVVSTSDTTGYFEGEHGTVSSHDCGEKQQQKKNIAIYNLNCCKHYSLGINLFKL